MSAPHDRDAVLALLDAAVRAGTRDRHPARGQAAGLEIAATMVTAGLTTPADLLAALERLGGGSPVDALRSALVAEHARLTQRTMLEQQEAIHQAVLSALAEAGVRRRASETRFSVLVANAPVGIGIGDVAGNILQVNEALERMFGYSAEEMVVRGVQSFMHPDDAPQVWQFYQELISGHRDSFRTEKRYLRKDGSVIWTDLSVSLIRDDAGHPTHQIAVIQDITDRHELQERLRHAATHDPLTGLPNRSLFMEHLEATIGSSPPGARVALCFLDVDDFKMLNDIRGHLVGDRVLVEIGNRLTAATAGTGVMLARLGGDEFVVLSSTGGESTLSAEDLGDRLIDALRDPIRIAGSRPIPMRASVGLVELPAGDATAESLLQAADLARRAAKEEGKGRVVRHDPDRTALQLRRVRTALSLPGVVERGELYAEHQPMVRLDDGSLHGMELLLRWRHPELGDLAPDDFIPIAEESGDIGAIGDWVIGRACQDLACHDDWPVININVSVHQLYRPTLLEEIQLALAEAGVLPQRLRVELTETAIVKPIDPVPMRVIRDLADLGVRLVLDDFGTGYSNMAALRRLPIAELKLASSFVGTPGHDPDEVDRRILRSVVELAHDLGALVVVEGIETAEQHDWVTGTGCDVAQGFFYDSR